MKTIILILLGFTLTAWAQKEASQTNLATILEEIRDPAFSKAERRFFLEFVRGQMAQNLAKEMGVTVPEINLAFLNNPAKARLLYSDDWYDVQTQFYTTLHLENYRERWLNLQKLHKFSDYGNSINNTMMGRLSQYSPVEEGRFYIRWNQVEVKADNKVKSFKIPYFLMSPNINELIQMEAHTPYEELFPNKTNFANFQSATEKLPRINKQELAERIELNRRIYIRAVANSAKTIASVRYLSGELSRNETENKISAFLENYCEGCSVSEKKEYLAAAMTYIDKMKKTVNVASVDDLKKDLCRTLLQSNYQWSVDKSRPAPIDVLLDSSKLFNYYNDLKLKDQNRKALAQALINHDLGILFLTGALNVLDKSQEPIGTRLGCIKNTNDNDINLVKAAIDEAEKNVEAYVVRVNQQIAFAKYDKANLTSTLDYFVQTNQASSIEAAATFPQGIGYILKSIAELDRSVIARKRTDKVVAWGGTIVGIGLTLSGIGAPEGVAVLISTATILKGITAGTYYLVRSKQEKDFFKEIRLAQRGASGVSDENLKMHYAAYKKLKVNFIMEYASSALEFTKLYRIALNQSNGSAEVANTMLKRVLGMAVKVGKAEALSKIQEFIISGIIESESH